MADGGGEGGRGTPMIAVEDEYGYRSAPRVQHQSTQFDDDYYYEGDTQVFIGDPTAPCRLCIPSLRRVVFHDGESWRGKLASDEVIHKLVESVDFDGDQLEVSVEAANIEEEAIVSLRKGLGRLPHARIVLLS